MHGITVIRKFISMREWAKIIIGLGLLYYGVLRGAKSLIIKVKSYSFAGIDVASGTVSLYLNLLIKNPLVVGVQIKGAIGDVYVQGHKVGYVNMSYDYYLAGGHTHILPVVVNLNMGDVAQGALMNIQSGDIRNLTISFDGKVYAGKYSVGIPVQFDLDYNDLTK